MDRQARSVGGLVTPVSNSGELGALSPKFAEGLARVREVTDRDGALPARFKALCMAGTAAAKGHRELMARELGRAAELGLPERWVRGAAMALLISRGEAVYEAFAEAAGAAFGPGAADDGEGERAAAATRFDVSVASARGYFRATFGSVPGYIETLAEGSPRALEGYFLMREAAVGENPLPSKMVELFYLPVNAADLQARLVGIHAAAARQAGASQAEIVEATVCAIPVAGAPSWVMAAEAVAPPAS
jgi:4-carboxymuconolactone decarboxylase